MLLGYGEGRRLTKQQFIEILSHANILANTVDYFTGRIALNMLEEVRSAWKADVERATCPARDGS